MRHKLGETRYRIGLTVALVALVGIAGISWWLIPILWEASSVVRMAGDALLALLFAVVILLIWLLHSDPSRD